MARAEGAEVVLTGRNAERLEQAAADVGARSTSAFDASDPAALGRFFAGLPGPVDHVMVTAGRPNYAQLADMAAEEVRDAVSEHMAGRSRSRATCPTTCDPGAAWC